MNVIRTHYFIEPTHNVRETGRQRDVRMLLLQGLTNKEIADRLKLGTACIKYHLGKLYVLWKVKNRHELMAIFNILKGDL